MIIDSSLLFIGPPCITWCWMVSFYDMHVLNAHYMTMMMS